MSDERIRELQRQARLDPGNARVMRELASLQSRSMKVPDTRAELFEQTWAIAQAPGAEFAFDSFVESVARSFPGNRSRRSTSHIQRAYVNYHNPDLNDFQAPEERRRHYFKTDIMLWIGGLFMAKKGFDYVGNIRRAVAPDVPRGDPYWKTAWYARAFKAWARKRGAKILTKTESGQWPLRLIALETDGDASLLLLATAMPWPMSASSHYVDKLDRSVNSIESMLAINRNRESRSDYSTDYHDPGGVNFPNDYAPGLAYELYQVAKKEGWPVPATVYGLDLVEKGKPKPKPKKKAPRKAKPKPGSPVPAPTGEGFLPQPNQGGDILIHHSPEHGTIITGGTKTYKDEIKALRDPRFRWSRKLGAWYVSRSRGVQGDGGYDWGALSKVFRDAGASVELEFPGVEEWQAARTPRPGAPAPVPASNIEAAKAALFKLAENISDLMKPVWRKPYKGWDLEIEFRNSDLDSLRYAYDGDSDEEEYQMDSAITEIEEDFEARIKEAVSSFGETQLEFSEKGFGTIALKLHRARPAAPAPARQSPPRGMQQAWGEASKLGSDISSSPPRPMERAPTHIPADRVFKRGKSSKWWVRPFASTTTMPASFKTKRDATTWARTNEVEAKQAGATDADETAAIKALGGRLPAAPATAPKIEAGPVGKPYDSLVLGDYIQLKDKRYGYIIGFTRGSYRAKQSPKIAIWDGNAGGFWRQAEKGQIVKREDYSGTMTAYQKKQNKALMAEDKPPFLKDNGTRHAVEVGRGDAAKGESYFAPKPAPMPVAAPPQTASLFGAPQEPVDDSMELIANNIERAKRIAKAAGAPPGVYPRSGDLVMAWGHGSVGATGREVFSLKQLIVNNDGPWYGNINSSVDLTHSYILRSDFDFNRKPVIYPGMKAKSGLKYLDGSSSAIGSKIRSLKPELRGQALIKNINYFLKKFEIQLDQEHHLWILDDRTKPCQEFKAAQAEGQPYNFWGDGCEWSYAGVIKPVKVKGQAKKASTYHTDRVPQLGAGGTAPKGYVAGILAHSEGAQAEKDAAVRAARLRGEMRSSFIFVGCTKSKHDKPMAAADIYTKSRLFRLRRAYVEARKTPWSIVSALHGLIRSPYEQVIAPYNVAMSSVKKDPEKLREWRELVSSQMHQLGPHKGVRLIEVHAGKDYLEALKGLEQKHSVSFFSPFEGSGLGHVKQEAWYRDQLKKMGASIPSKATPPAGASTDKLRSVYEEDTGANRGALVGLAFVNFGTANKPALWKLLGEAKGTASNVRALGVSFCPVSKSNNFVVAARGTAALIKRLDKRHGRPKTIPRVATALDDDWVAYELPTPSETWPAVSEALLDEKQWPKLAPKKPTKTQKRKLRKAKRPSQAQKWMTAGKRSFEHDIGAKRARRRAEIAIKSLQKRLKAAKSEEKKVDLGEAIEANRAIIDAYNVYLDPNKTPVDSASYVSHRKKARPSKRSTYQPSLPSGSRPKVTRGDDRFVVSQLASALALGVLVDYSALNKMKARETPPPPILKEEKSDADIKRYSCKPGEPGGNIPAWAQNQCKGLLFDSEGRRYSYEIDVLPIEQVITSHDDQFLPVPLFPQELQARDRGSVENQLEVQKIAREMDPERLLQVGPTATEGTPIIWAAPLAGGGKGMVALAGNGRTMAFRQAPAEIQAKYLDLVHYLTGRRGLLVRRIQRVDKQGALRFAAASQESAGAAQTPLEKSRGLSRSIGIKSFAELPPIDTTSLRGSPLGDDERRFSKFEVANKSLRARAFPTGEAAQWRARAERYALIFLSLLPEDAKNAIEDMGPAAEAVLVGMSPYLGEMGSRWSKGEFSQVGDYLNVTPSLARIAPVMSKYKGWSPSRVFADLSQRFSQPTLAGFEEADPLAGLSFVDVSWLLGILRAAATTNPEKRGATLGYKLVKAADSELVDVQQAMFGYEPDVRKFISRVFASKKGADAKVAKESEELMAIIEDAMRNRPKQNPCLPCFVNPRHNPVLMLGNPKHRDTRLDRYIEGY